MLQVECALSSGDLCTESGMTNGLCVPLLCADYEVKDESHSQRMNFRGGEKAASAWTRSLLADNRQSHRWLYGFRFCSTQNTLNIVALNILNSTFSSFQFPNILLIWVCGRTWQKSSWLLSTLPVYRLAPNEVFNLVFHPIDSDNRKVAWSLWTWPCSEEWLSSSSGCWRLCVGACHSQPAFP